MGCLGRREGTNDVLVVWGGGRGGGITDARVVWGGVGLSGEEGGEEHH